jgi:hypothetical protein
MFKVIKEFEINPRDEKWCGKCKQKTGLGDNTNCRIYKKRLIRNVDAYQCEKCKSILADFHRLSECIEDEKSEIPESKFKKDDIVYSIEKAKNGNIYLWGIITNISYNDKCKTYYYICKNTGDFYKYTPLPEHCLCLRDEADKLIQQYNKENFELYNGIQIFFYDETDKSLRLSMGFDCKYIKNVYYVWQGFKDRTEACKQAKVVIESLKQSTEKNINDIDFSLHRSSSGPYNYFVYIPDNFDIDFCSNKNQLSFKYIDGTINFCIWYLIKCDSVEKANQISKEIYFAIRKFFQSKKDTTID